MSGARRVGVYPGTFDPITNGHTDIILRAATLVDDLIVAVASNAGKGPLFGSDERAELVRNVVDEQGKEIAARVHIHTRRRGAWLHSIAMLGEACRLCSPRCCCVLACIVAYNRLNSQGSQRT